MKLFAKILRFTLRKFYSLPLKNKNIKIGKNFQHGDFHFHEISNQVNEVIIGENVKLYNFVNLIVGKNAKLIIGDNTTINKFSSIVALENVSIGKNCLIGENVKIYDNNHKVCKVNGINLPEHKKFVTQKTIIGKNCWLGSNVTVLKGVTIGDNCIIGAGCTIYKDIPSNSTVINNQNLHIY